MKELRGTCPISVVCLKVLKMVKKTRKKMTEKVGNEEVLLKKFSSFLPQFMISFEWKRVMIRLLLRHARKGPRYHKVRRK
jgi:hypothetical protein